MGPRERLVVDRSGATQNTTQRAEKGLPEVFCADQAIEMIGASDRIRTDDIQIHNLAL